MAPHDDDARDLSAQIDRFVDEHRAACLWFLRPDYYPRTPAEQAHVLQRIERHSDLAAYQRARMLRQWLSRPSSAPSVAS
jgi:hypothetical protein